MIRQTASQRKVLRDYQAARARLAPRPTWLARLIAILMQRGEP